MIDIETPNNYQCLICGHTSSVFKSFQHHMKQHPPADPPEEEYEQV